MHRVVRYDQVTVDGAGGPDVAEMFDTPYQDEFSGWPDGCVYNRDCRKHGLCETNSREGLGAVVFGCIFSMAI